MSDIANGGLIGLTVALPIGPIGMLCISRTLHRGRLSGIATGLGSSTVQACYAAIAISGAETAGNFLNAHAAAVQVIGGVVLLAFGVSLILDTKRTSTESMGMGSLKEDYGSAVCMALCNPMTILGIAGGIAVFANTAEVSRSHVMLGVVLGSAAWYVGMSLVAGALRSRLSPTVISLINLGAGFLLCATGLTAILTAL